MITGGVVLSVLI